MGLRHPHVNGKTIPMCCCSLIGGFAVYILAAAPGCGVSCPVRDGDLIVNIQMRNRYDEYVRLKNDCPTYV